MKVTIELDYPIMLAVADKIAKDTADGWWGGANAPECDMLTKKTLYQYAFADGMQYLTELMEKERGNKMTKYIIIVSVYDEENTRAYPIGWLFPTREEAERYIADYWKRIKSDHWTCDKVDGIGGYTEGFNAVGDWIGEDAFDGRSLEITIHEVEEL